MKCNICKHGITQLGTTTITLERGELTLVIKGVPAQVCANCGEEYVDENIAGELLNVAEEAVRTGAQVEIRQYKAA